ncbi:MAG: DEAD/DEAH box helicase [Limisphaerales bacterium]
MSHALTLSPGGHLLVETDEQAEPKLSPATALRLSEAFAASTAAGLESLAGEFLREPLPPTFVFWRGLAQSCFTALCHHPDPDASAHLVLAKPDDPAWERWVESAPPMKGIEYLTTAVVSRFWDELDQRVHAEIALTPGGPAAYLKATNPVWNAVGRVTFHLAENKRDPDRPFAFLATYTHRVSEQGKAQHLPLGRALEEYAGARNRTVLAALLLPVQRAAEKSQLARRLLDSRAIFHPQLWQPAQAYAFLKEIPLFEQSGVSVRIPDWWKAGRPPRPQVNVRIGQAGANLLGKDGLLDFTMEMMLDGEPLTEAERRAILNSTNGLVLLKGKWVEVDHERLEEVLAHWKRVRSAAGPGGVSLLQGLRLLSGFDPGAASSPEAEGTRVEWSRVVAGDGLKKALEEMQNPTVAEESDPGADLRTELRPYQRQGAHWLWFMNRLGLGACLADDMGLGKTIQVLALLLVLKRPAPDVTPRTSVLVVPASLIGNWRAEIEKFAPSLRVFYAHPSEMDPEIIAATGRDPAGALAQTDLLITSYSMVTRLGWLKEMNWNLGILDEAQAIKNPGARQTVAVKQLRCRCRMVLSGTPIENRLSDLWSLFDFICPGLLGGATEFGAFVKSRAHLEHDQFTPLRHLVRPYILRRLKTDKRIIADLPEKTEMIAFCSFSRRQAALYEQSVREMGERLESPDIEGIQRRGVILAFLTRLKQICNHPSQWLGDGNYPPADSGKFQRLRELCEEIAARQEKVLVFTQYREITDPLARHLAGVFGRPGLVLHGQTPVGKRRELVTDFQRADGPPFFVLSLKAGGTGLNLTAAAHVIHFDRWWNPAVENQATDRAFRIGQKRNVVVHKFVCRGTLEERIHELIAGKASLAEDVLGEGSERLLTEMSNAELLRFVSLDMKGALEE